MNQIISICVTDDQMHQIGTSQMIDAVNRNHRDAQTRTRDRRYRNYIRRKDLRARHKAFCNRLAMALSVGAAGVFCLSCALLGLASRPLFVPIGTACVLYAAALAGMLMQERKVAK